MPWVSIGHCGTSESPGDTFEFELGIEYLKLVCGEVPEGCELGVMWREFDGIKVGEVIDLPAGVGLLWDDTKILGAPWEYISRCETALSIFGSAREFVSDRILGGFADLGHFRHPAKPWYINELNRDAQNLTSAPCGRTTLACSPPRSLSVPSTSYRPPTVTLVSCPGPLPHPG
jgi:hypothetical protein